MGRALVFHVGHLARPAASVRRGSLVLACRSLLRRSALPGRNSDFFFFFFFFERDLIFSWRWFLRVILIVFSFIDGIAAATRSRPCAMPSRYRAVAINGAQGCYRAQSGTKTTLIEELRKTKRQAAEPMARRESTASSSRSGDRLPEQVAKLIRKRRCCPRAIYRSSG